MIETQIISSEKPKLKKPICIVGLPGIGHIGRIAAEYMIQELKAKKFAELYSPYFFPFVIIHENKIHTLKNEFYYYKSKTGSDIIFLIGDVQTYDPKGHYEVTGKITDFLKTFGCKEIITIGGFATGEVKEKPEVYAVPLENSKYDFKKFELNTQISGKVGTIVGASGLMLGIGKLKGMGGFCLLGETSGYPIVTDPNAAEAVLLRLQKILKLKINMSKLKEKVEAMHEFIKKLADIQKQGDEMHPAKQANPQLKYIG